MRSAEEAYREALKERTRERALMSWAETQNNLGLALQRLGKLTGDPTTLRSAEEAYREVLKERTRRCYGRRLRTMLASCCKFSANF